MQKNDRHEALQALGERSVLLTELKQINSGYFRYNTRAIGSPYQGCASAEVKADIAKGDGLEKYLKA